MDGQDLQDLGYCRMQDSRAGRAVAAGGNFSFCGQMRTFPGIGVIYIDGRDRDGRISERVFYIHTLIVRGAAGVGKGWVSVTER